MSARLTSLVNCSTTEAEVECESPASYSVSYQASVRGRHELSVQVNGQSIAGSPFRVYIQQPTRLLGRPVRVIKGFKLPTRVAVGDRGQLLIANKEGVSVFDGEGDLVNTFTSFGPLPEGAPLSPLGIALDTSGSMYTIDSQTQKLLKMSVTGEALKAAGGRGSEIGKFNRADGLAVYGDKLSVCDRKNHRILTFDLDLNCISSCGCYGNNEGQLNQPADLAFDTEGSMYVVDSGNHRVQVFSPSGTFLRMFGGRGSGPGELDEPIGIHVDCSRVYVSEWGNHRVSVFTTLGEFVTSFGGLGNGEGEFRLPRGIAVGRDGYLYVCDVCNARVQVF